MSKKLALYSRTSTDQQTSGLEAQQRALHDWMKYKGIAPEDVLEFSDEGISGTKRSRPGFDRMMAAVREGMVHTVLVYSFSRFARNTKHLIEALEEFEKLGVDFVSHSENIDTKGPVGKLVYRVFAALSEFERDQIAERVKNGLKNARAKGKVLGRPKVDVEVDEMVALHRGGASLRAIAKRLGVPVSTVARRLREVYQKPGSEG